MTAPAETGGAFFSFFVRFDWKLETQIFIMSLKTLARAVGLRAPAKLTAASVASTYQSSSPTLGHSPLAAHLRKRLPFRPGIAAFKRGMTAWFDENGKQFPCTVLEVDRVQVTNVRSDPSKGFFSVQLGLGSVKFSNISRQLLGHFSRAQVAPKRRTVEFQVRDESGLLPLGTELKADHFYEGQYVDVQSITKGKGFAGVMKRWGFGGLRATHGTSAAHRSAGSTGMNQDPGRVVPGKKMAGNMGNKSNTIQRVKVVKIYADKGLILVKGPVSGAKGRVVKIVDSKKAACPSDLKEKWLAFRQSVGKPAA